MVDLETTVSLEIADEPEARQPTRRRLHECRTTPWMGEAEFHRECHRGTATQGVKIKQAKTEDAKA